MRVEIKPSNYFYVALIGVASLTIAAIFYAQLSWPLHILFAICVCFYAGYCWHSQKRQRGMLQWNSAWSWVDEKNAKSVLQLRHSTVWPAIVALLFYDNERKRYMAFTLLPDSFEFADDARRLRAYLNHFPVFDWQVSADEAD